MTVYSNWEGKPVTFDKDAMKMAYMAGWSDGNLDAEPDFEDYFNYVWGEPDCG